MVQLTPYTVPLGLVIGVSLVGAGIMARQRESRAETWFAGVELAAALWATIQLVVLSVDDPELIHRLIAVGFPLTSYLPLTMFVFTLYYTGRSHLLTGRRLAGLLAIPWAISGANAAMYTDELGLVNQRLVDHGGYAILEFDWGLVAFLSASVSYVFVAGTVVMLVQKFRRSRNVYRNMTFVLLGSTVVLAAASVVTFANLSPVPYMTLTPLLFLVFGALAIAGTVSVRFVRAIPVDRVLSLLGSRFGGVLPLARDFVVEEIDAGVVVLDADQRIVDINSVGKEMLGTDRAVGRHVKSVIDLDRVIESETPLDRLETLSDADERHEQLWVEGDDGDRCFDLTISSLRTDGGSVVGRVVLLHDVTERKRREDALRERERTLRRQKRDLEQQTTKLEHQNERLDQFAGIVSHDLRNPLSISDGIAELALQGVDADQETVEVDVDRLKRIREANERMGAIVDDALTLARQGKAITETHPVGLADLARDAWTNVDTDAATLVVDTDRRIEADRDRLLTVFENCFRNSLDHGHDAVTVTVGEIDRPDTRGFYVADDGPGIPDERKDAVLDHGFTTSDDGTGLGLAIVDDAASAHGWNLSVTDSDDGGARFEFTGVGDPRPDSTARNDRSIEESVESPVTDTSDRE